MKNITILCTILLLGYLSPSTAQVYVDASATGTGNGTSWANAYTDLTDALLATSTGEIWVAQGTYLPSKDLLGFTPASDEQKTFKIPSGVAVYGGFNGTETALSQRNWLSNQTILDGDFGNGSKTYHVVSMSNVNAQTLLDGFTIQNGEATGSSSAANGGGINVTGTSSPTIQHCTIKNNIAKTYGGGVYVISTGTPKFINCRMNGNLTTAASSRGGGAYLRNCTAPEIINCLIDNNECDRFGGGISLLECSNITVLNCTFADNFNRVNSVGAGISSTTSSSTSPNGLIKNCIFYQNFAGATSLQNIHSNPSSFTVDHCLSQDGNNSFSQNTSFISNTMIGTADFVDVNNQNYQLACLGFGANMGDTVGITLPATDLLGNPRIAKGDLDLGAYENNDGVGIVATDTVVCAGEYVTLRGTCDNFFTWSGGVINGQPFVPTATTTYTCTGQASGQSAQITIKVVNVNNETVTGPSTVCLGSSTTISTGGSVQGVDYYLLDAADSTYVDGPIAGTGAGITLNTPAIDVPTNYVVYGILENTGELVPANNKSICLDFDGSNDKVNTNFALPTSSEFSVEAWIYPRGTTHDRILSTYDASGGVSSNEIVFDTYGSISNGRGLRLTTGSGNNVEAANVLTLNQWQHVAATFANGAVTLFVNGVTVASGTFASSTIGGSSRKFTIGCDNANSPNVHFDGKIDELRLWSKALTAAEVLNNMNDCLDGTETDLTLYYDFEDGTGSATTTDKTANNYDGTLISMSPATDWVNDGRLCNKKIIVPKNPTGTALDFDGSNDKVNTSLTIPASNNLSIEAWIYPRGTTHDRIISSYDATNGVSSTELVLDTYGGTSNGRGLRLITGTGSVEAANVLTLNQWNHVAAIFTNGNAVLLVNGASVASGTFSSSTISGTSRTITIGCDNANSPTVHFNGKIDELRIWNKALTQSDVLNNMNQCLVGNETDLMAYYNFENGEGSDVWDLVAAKDGELVNMDAATDWVEGKHTCKMICDQTMATTVTITPTIVDTTVLLSGNTLTSNATAATYQWVDCNNSNTPIGGAINQSFMPTTSGDYAVEVTKNGCTEMSACYNVVLTGVENIANNNRIAIYPNPTAGQLRVDLFEEQTEVALTVSNALGQTVQQVNYNTTQQIDLAIEGANGLYFIHITSAEGLNQTVRIIKK